MNKIIITDTNKVIINEKEILSITFINSYDLRRILNELNIDFELIDKRNLTIV